MQFHVRSARPGDTQVSEQWQEAVSEAALRSHLQSQGIGVLSIRAKRPVVSLPWTRSGVTPRQQFPVFCREVRTLIRAGMTIVEAVDTLCAQARKNSKDGGLAAELLNSMQRGQSLSTALSNISGTPMVLIAAVRSGERTSNLVAALDDYLRYDELLEQLRRKVISAAIYPMLVCGLGLAIALFLLLVVMPRFASMYENLRGGQDLAPSSVILLSRFIAQYQWPVLAVLTLLAACMVAWFVTGGAKRFVLRVANHLPGIKSRMQDFDLAMMYQALKLLVKGGFPLVDALGVAQEAALNPHLCASVSQARVRIEQGASVAQSFYDASLCDEVGRRLMAAAERNGDFHLAADVVSQIHGQRFELFVERLTRVVEPILLIAVTLLVGSIVIVMYQPVFDMATQIR